MKPTGASDPATLRDMLQACADISTSTTGISFEQFLADSNAMRSAAFSFAVLGEAVKRLSLEFRTDHPAIPWHSIASMRNRIIHGYDTIEWRLLWDSATNDVLPLREQLQKIVDDLGISLSPS